MPRSASVFLCHKSATTRKKPRTKEREGAGIFQPIRGIYEGGYIASSMRKNQPPKMRKSTPQNEEGENIKPIKSTSYGGKNSLVFFISFVDIKGRPWLHAMPSNRTEGRTTRTSSPVLSQSSNHACSLNRINASSNLFNSRLLFFLNEGEAVLIFM